MVHIPIIRLQIMQNMCELISRCVKSSVSSSFKNNYETFLLVHFISISGDLKMKNTIHLHIIHLCTPIHSLLGKVLDMNSLVGFLMSQPL